jgi:hypothetical protein
MHVVSLEWCKRKNAQHPAKPNAVSTTRHTRETAATHVSLSQPAQPASKPKHSQTQKHTNPLSSKDVVVHVRISHNNIKRKNQETRQTTFRNRINNYSHATPQKQKES